MLCTSIVSFHIMSRASNAEPKRISNAGDMTTFHSLHRIDAVNNCVSLAHFETMAVMFGALNRFIGRLD